MTETSALESRLSRFKDVLITLVRAELRDQREFTVIGVIKWTLEPLVYMFIYYLIIASILAGQQHAYLLFLLCALLPWQYFQGVTTRALQIIQGYGSIVGNRVLPRGMLPFVPVLTEGASFLVSLGLLFPMMAVESISPSVQLLWLPVLVLELVIVCAGPAYILALWGLYLPDFRGALSSILRVGFFASTALVAAKDVPGDHLPDLLRANPLSGIFDGMRAIFVQGRAPGTFELLYPTAVGCFLLVVGLLLYRWREPYIAKEV